VIVLTRGFALGVLLAIVACTSMQRVEPAQFIPQHNPEAVSVWTARRVVTIVTDPRVTGDTLSGEVLGERWAVALRDVVRVEARRPSPQRTVLLIAGAAASAVGVYFLSGGPQSSTIPCGSGLPPGLLQQQCGGP
jgi:hypothetical protein